jgi:replication factor C subunit 3/5
MSTLADKYQPTSLKDLHYNQQINHVLTSLSQTNQLPHLIIEGYRGSGKKTRALLFLKEKYGNFNTSKVQISLKISGKPKELSILASRYHYQINPNLHNIYDRSLMQSFINTVVECEIISSIPYKIIIIEDADLLTIEAQESLRKTLETYIARCRFIFLSNKEGRIIDPIYSRCIKIKVSSPSSQEIQDILSDICNKEGKSSQICQEISLNCNRNLSTAIRYLEKYLTLTSYPTLFEQPDHSKLLFKLEDHDNVYRYCTKVINAIITGTDIITTMDNVRSLLYELMNYCTDIKDVLPILLEIVLSKIGAVKHQEKYTICNLAGLRDESVRTSSKSIYHIEGFCLHLFGIIKTMMETPTTAKHKPVFRKLNKVN